MKTLGPVEIDYLVNEPLVLKKPGRFWLNSEISVLDQLRAGLPSKVNGDFLLFVVMKKAAKESRINIRGYFNKWGEHTGGRNLVVNYMDSDFIQVKGFEGVMHQLLKMAHNKQSPIENAILLSLFTLGFILSCVSVLVCEPSDSTNDTVLAGNLGALLYVALRLIYKLKTANQYYYPLS